MDPNVIDLDQARSEKIEKIRQNTEEQRREMFLCICTRWFGMIVVVVGVVMGLLWALGPYFLANTRFSSENFALSLLAYVGGIMTGGLLGLGIFLHHKLHSNQSQDRSV